MDGYVARLLMRDAIAIERTDFKSFVIGGEFVLALFAMRVYRSMRGSRCRTLLKVTDASWAARRC
jgi:hypothetical protein